MAIEEEENSSAALAQEQSIFDTEKSDTRRFYQSIKLARRVLFWLSALSLVPLFFYYGSEEGPPDLFLVGVVISFPAIYLFCALYSRKEPLTSILIGLLVYCGLSIYGFITNPGNFFNLTLAFKVLIIVILVRGVLHAIKLNRIEKTFGEQ